MSFTVTCPYCCMRSTGPDNALGQRIRCPQCAAILSIPAPVSAPSPPPAGARRADRGPGNFGLIIGLSFVAVLLASRVLAKLARVEADVLAANGFF